MLGSTLINYFLGRWIDRESDASRRKWAVALAVGLNVGLLAFFKYANFTVDNLNWMFTALGASPVHVASVRLPIGISFFTFHAVSYVVDIYRRKWAPAKSPDVALYIFFFPQLIAGPILRWNAIAPQIASRIQMTAEQFAQGARRFIMGLAKKVLIANVVAVPADQIFKMCSDGQDLSPALAWLGALCYTLQIYFDFSGYSDMAIGLGKMFGFEFMENFNYPYISQSIRPFLAAVAYLPLELVSRLSLHSSGWQSLFDLAQPPESAPGFPPLRFVAWRQLDFCRLGFIPWLFYHAGTYSGFACGCLGAFPDLWRHLYALLVVVVGWVIFRASTFLNALAFLGNMQSELLTSVKLRFGCWNSCSVTRLPDQSSQESHSLRRFGGLWSEGTVENWKHCHRLSSRSRARLEPFCVWCCWCALLVISSAWLAGGTYNPFIYFRFLGHEPGHLGI